MSITALQTAIAVIGIDIRSTSPASISHLVNDCAYARARGGRSRSRRMEIFSDRAAPAR